MVGAYADGWVSPLQIYLPPAYVVAQCQVIDRAALKAGGRPSDVRRLNDVIGLIGESAGSRSGLNATPAM